MLVWVFDLIALRWSPGKVTLQKIPVGLAVGLIGIIVIQTHWKLTNGAIFDTRSILLSISGLFFGTIPTVIAMIMTAVFRIYQGGIGIVPGILVIIFTGSVGIGWRHFRKKSLVNYTFLDFYLFGIAVHVVMLGLMMTFPRDTAMVILQVISMPVLVIYPLGTALLGLLMTQRIQRDSITEEITANELKFRIIADHTSDWEYWVDSDHRFLFCSTSCEKITGYSNAEFLDNALLLRAIVHPDDLPIVETHKHSIDLHFPGRIEFRIIHRNGSIRWIEHGCVPVYSNEGTYLGTRGSNRDITDRKIAEGNMIAAKNEIDALLHITEDSRKALLSVVEDQKIAQATIVALNEELEDRIAERTEELRNANTELESFSYTVSHDLRAPLRAITGFSRILFDEHRKNLRADGKELVKDILHNTNRMSELIDDLLALSRISRKEMIKTEIDMAGLFAKTFAELTSAASGRTIHFSVDALPPLYGDLSLFKQVAVNLLSNAIKFSSKQEQPKISVTSTAGSGENTYRITDNGVGFDMKYADRLFKPFQRLHHADDFEGTGVGLAIVKRIIVRHNGSVSVVSAVQQGTTVEFTVPVQ